MKTQCPKCGTVFRAHWNPPEPRTHWEPGCDGYLEAQCPNCLHDCTEECSECGADAPLGRLCPGCEDDALREYAADQRLDAERNGDYL